MNEFIKLCSSPMMNTQNVYRYSGTKMIEQESLSQHILDTMMLGYLIIDKLKHEFHEDIETSVYLEKALHHDMEESMTGDVVRTLKYHNPQVHQELQIVANSISWEMYNEYFTNGAQMFDIWSHAKEGKEGFILKLVDTLTVANKVIREIEFFQNMYFLRVAYEVIIFMKDLLVGIEKHKEFREESIKYLKSIAQDAIDSVEKILNTYLDVAQEYNIVGKSLLNTRKEVVAHE